MFEILEKYKDKKVLVTGHTGFKGSWLCKILSMLGADVVGYALEPSTDISLYELLKLDDDVNSIIGDIRDYEKLDKVFEEYKPEIVFHLAAQPIVRTSYKEPRMTYETNVMGTVNVCECIRTHSCVRSFLNVTTDKVYKNKEWVWGYREDDILDGYDPYSNSKSCSELVTHSYINSYFKEMDISVSTARAGNVIGGGDFSVDRIIPDCVRAVKLGETMRIRNPYSIRPYQHVLEPVITYLKIAISQINDKSKQGFYNIGPDDKDCINTLDLVELFKKSYGEGFDFQIENNSKGPHEAGFLRLDTSLVRATFGYIPTWDIGDAVGKTVEWTKVWLEDNTPESINNIVARQIQEFCDECKFL